jgi:hypothetical protein
VGGTNCRPFYLIPIGHQRWYPHVETTASVAPVPSAGPLTTIAVFDPDATRHGENVTFSGSVGGTVVPAANVGYGKFNVPLIVPVTCDRNNLGLCWVDYVAFG